MGTAEQYAHFGRTYARASSPIFEEWSLGVADDPEVIALIDRLPPLKRQAILVFAAARFQGAPIGPYAGFRDFLVAHWPEIEATALSHATQTNEAGRTALLLPVLARLPGPLALIEVGASAGLCLYPDRYSFRYSGHPQLDPADGPSEVVIDCTVTGDPPIPTRMPEIVSRAGVDLNPLDVTSDEDLHWLETLVWPEQDDRRERLRNAAAIARRDPPSILAGDLNETVERLVAEAPAGSTPVVFHSAVMMYLDSDARDRFVRMIGELPCHWISNEDVPVMPQFIPKLPRPIEEVRSSFVIALDGEPLAFTGGHGQYLDWFGG